MFPYTPIYGNIPYILHSHMPYTMCFVFPKILIFGNNVCVVITWREQPRHWSMVAFDASLVNWSSTKQAVDLLPPISPFISKEQTAFSDVVQVNYWTNKGRNGEGEIYLVNCIEAHLVNSREELQWHYTHCESTVLGSSRHETDQVRIPPLTPTATSRKL